MLNSLSRTADAVSRWLAYLSGGAIFLIAALQVLEIASRNLLDRSLSIVWEVGPYLHVAAIFLAAAYTLRTGGHIRVTLAQRLHPRAFELLATLVGTVVSLFLTAALVKFAWNYGVTGRTSGTTNNIALVWPAAAMAFGATMLSLQLVLRLALALRGRPVEVAAPHESLSAD
jgi:TRAP-type C4-dicarboxylate transport system permease small subunit